MTVREALREGAAALARTETPFLDASLLLAAALGTDTARILSSGPEEIGELPLARYRSSLGSRSRGLPVAYILGYKEFWGRRFAVDPRVLVPRPETETLVEASLKLGDIILREREGKTVSRFATETGGGENESPSTPSSPASSLLSRSSPSLHVESRGHFSRLRVHECCAGSGCVAISVAAERPDWAVSASDLSEDALEVARANSSELIAPGRPGGALVFFRSDLLSAVPERASCDLIIANPPYVTSAEAAALLGQGWSEPRMALDGGLDGLDLIRRLVGQAALALAPGGALLVEADGGQAAAVAELFRASRFVEVRASRDLGGADRVTSGRRAWTP